MINAIYGEKPLGTLGMLWKKEFNHSFFLFLIPLINLTIIKKIKNSNLN